MHSMLPDIAVPVQGQSNDIKPAHGGPYLAGSQLTRPLGGSAPINIDPALLQSLQSLTQANQLPAQQVPGSLTSPIACPCRLFCVRLAPGLCSNYRLPSSTAVHVQRTDHTKQPSSEMQACLMAQLATFLALL